MAHRNRVDLPTKSGGSFQSYVELPECKLSMNNMIGGLEHVQFVHSVGKNPN